MSEVVTTDSTTAAAIVATIASVLQVRVRLRVTPPAGLIVAAALAVAAAEAPSVSGITATAGGAATRGRWTPWALTAARVRALRSAGDISRMAARMTPEDRRSRASSVVHGSQPAR